VLLRSFHILLSEGLFQKSEESSPLNTAYVFTRGCLHRPKLHLPGPQKPIICIRCCPLLYKKRHPEQNLLFKLNYRIIYALITLESLILYDTENLYPIGLLDGIHYAELTDLTWAADGSKLVVASKDGYCTIVAFSEGELGEPLSLEEQFLKKQQDQDQDQKQNPHCMSTQDQANTEREERLITMEFS